MAANGVRRANGRWRPGTSGNPAGRPPKGQTLTDLLAELGDVTTGEGISRKQALCAKLWEIALTGDLAACRLILEYLDGKAVERVVAEVSGPMAPFTATEAAQAEADLGVWEEGLGDLDGTAGE